MPIPTEIADEFYRLNVKKLSRMELVLKAQRLMVIHFFPA